MNLEIQKSNRKNIIWAWKNFKAFLEKNEKKKKKNHRYLYKNLNYNHRLLKLLS